MIHRDEEKIRLVNQRAAVDESRNILRDNISRDWGLYGIDTGIHDLNMKIGGWIPKKVTVIAARSGHGKTSMTTPVFDVGSRDTGNRKPAFLFFSWETDPSQLVNRYVSYKVGVTLRQITQGAKLLGEKTREKIYAAYDEAYKLPIVYEPISLDIDKVKKVFYDFANKCEIKSTHGLHYQPIMVVDYIGLAKFVKNDIRSYDVADFVNGVKSLMNDTYGSALLLAQIKRASDEREFPVRNDLSDSQSIEQAADNLIIFHRPEYNYVRQIRNPETGENMDSKGKGLLRILKARDYGIGDVIIGCDIKYNRFYNLSHTWDFPYWNMYNDKEFWLNELTKNI